jgi:hypothetical protein
MDHGDPRIVSEELSGGGRASLIELDCHERGARRHGRDHPRGSVPGSRADLADAATHATCGEHAKKAADLRKTATRSAWLSIHWEAKLCGDTFSTLDKYRHVVHALRLAARHARRTEPAFGDARRDTRALPLGRANGCCQQVRSIEWSKGSASLPSVSPTSAEWVAPLTRLFPDASTRQKPSADKPASGEPDRNALELARAVDFSSNMALPGSRAERLDLLTVRRKQKPRRHRGARRRAEAFEILIASSRVAR